MLLNYQHWVLIVMKYTYINDIINHAIKNSCKVLLDAESHKVNLFQRPVIDKCSHIFNTESKCNVYKTYQMYLKDSMIEMKKDIEHFHNEDKWLGIKLVRGAYMTEDKHEDVIYNTKEETDMNYNEASNIILQHIQKGKKISVIFATHNKTSFYKIHDVICTNSIDSSNIYFATLMGMKNELTDTCLKLDYNTMKYVPYGPYHKTFPYLLRRLYENSSIIKHIC